MKLNKEYDCGMEGWGAAKVRKEKGTLLKLIEKFKLQFKEKCLEKLNVSQFHCIYPSLNTGLSEEIGLNSCLTRFEKNIMFKIWKQLWNLSFKHSMEGFQLHCSMRNLAEREEMIHFLGVCSILAEVRRLLWPSVQFIFCE